MFTPPGAENAMEARRRQDLEEPLVTLCRLRSNQDAPRVARVLIEEILAQGDGDTNGRREDLVLSVSELVANAVQYGAPGHLTLQVEKTGSSVRIEVGDDGVDAFTWPDGLGPDGHWGLNLVEQMSDRSGIDRRPWTVAWCEFDLAVERSG
jgi:anti-sigma regulatory factor (Ser/Thr protein kinase)